MMKRVGVVVVFVGERERERERVVWEVKDEECWW
jgi:hypothetical protein